jgi:general secretion pathway protein J
VERVATQRAYNDQSGFTLIEMVAAFAIASVIILAAAALLHNVALSFDRGTGRVAGGERLAVAAQRLSADIAAAGYVLQKTPAGIRPTFVGATDRVVFISSLAAPGPIAPPFAGRQVVSLTVEAAGDDSQIVRRQAAWPGPRAPFEDVTLGDDVILLKGAFDAAFQFARAMPDGSLSWVDSWTDEQTMPRSIKLTMRDRASGVDLLGGAEFALRADAPAACAIADASSNCLSGSSVQQPPSTQSGTQESSEASR